MKHKYKNGIVEAFSWTWGISMLALGLYFLTERNSWAVVCLAVGAPMFRTKLWWALYHHDGAAHILCVCILFRRFLDCGRGLSVDDGCLMYCRI